MSMVLLTIIKRHNFFRSHRSNPFFNLISQQQGFVKKIQPQEITPQETLVVGVWRFFLTNGQGAVYAAADLALTGQVKIFAEQLGWAGFFFFSDKQLLYGACKRSMSTQAGYNL